MDCAEIVDRFCVHCFLRLQIFRRRRTKRSRMPDPRSWKDTRPANFKAFRPEHMRYQSSMTRTRTANWTRTSWESPGKASEPPTMQRAILGLQNFPPPHFNTPEDPWL